jgi:hypothetical protein
LDVQLFDVGRGLLHMAAEALIDRTAAQRVDVGA